MTSLLSSRITDDLQAALARLEELIEAGDSDALAYNLTVITDAWRAMGDLRRAVEDALVEIAPWSGGIYEVDGLPLLELKGGTERKKWNWEALRPHLRRKVLDPEGTGTAPDAQTAAVVDAALDLMFEVAPLTGSNGPRVKAIGPLLREQERDVDEFCETKPGRSTVVIGGAG